VFTCTFRLTLPLPVPLAPVTVIHDGAPVVAHVQPPLVVTVTDVDPPAAAGENVVGLMPKLQPADWLTVNETPATVSVAVRAAPVFASIVRLTVPLPVPVPPVTLIHDGTPETLHAHALEVVTVNDVDPPPAPAE
jgi:hypothetical protein